MTEYKLLMLKFCPVDVPLGQNTFLIFTPILHLFMEQKIKFAENVMLIDASYIDQVGNDLKEHFAPLLQRELPKADLALLLEYLAMDGGLTGTDNEIQVIFIHDSHVEAFTFCTPSRFATELHDMAFKGSLGEYSLSSFQTSEMAVRQDLYKESLQLLCESKDVKRILLVPDEASLGEKVYSLISKEKRPMSVVFGMNPPQGDYAVRFEMLGFALLQALGVKAEEL